MKWNVIHIEKRGRNSDQEENKLINKDCTLQLKPTNYISDKNTEVNTKIIINIKAQDKKANKDNSW